MPRRGKRAHNGGLKAAGAVLRDMAKDAGYSQRRLGIEAGVRENSIGDYFAGRASPLYPNLSAMVGVLTSGDPKKPDFIEFGRRLREKLGYPPPEEPPVKEEGGVSVLEIELMHKCTELNKQLTELRSQLKAVEKERDELAKTKSQKLSNDPPTAEPSQE